MTTTITILGSHDGTDTTTNISMVFNGNYFGKDMVQIRRDFWNRLKTEYPDQTRKHLLHLSETNITTICVDTI